MLTHDHVDNDTLRGVGDLVLRFPVHDLSMDVVAVGLDDATSLGKMLQVKEHGKPFAASIAASIVVGVVRKLERI